MGTGLNISLFTSLAFLVLCVNRLIYTMKCPSSILITRRVDQCPRNALEWDKRATIFNCSLVNQTCVSPEMFDYHCVMNGDGTILIEVCAPIKTIHGHLCAEFDVKGGIIQENAYSCRNANVPCPPVYISTSAFKYQSCYDEVKEKQGIIKTSLENENIFKSSGNIYTSIALIVTGIIIVILLLCGLFCGIKKLITRKEISSHFEELKVLRKFPDKHSVCMETHQRFTL